MIAHLRGTILKGLPGELTVDVQGVGYRVSVPVNVWDETADKADARLWIPTYVREHRLEPLRSHDAQPSMLYQP